jgi:hypothetical protein
VRNLSAILLISIFAFSQYARQLSYIECKLSNTLRSSSLKCDCEKQAGFDKQDNKASPPAKAHLHIHLDEFFAISHVEILSHGFANAALPYLSDHDDELEGEYPTPWQPPNS